MEFDHASRLTQRVKVLKPSITLAIAARAKKLKAEGVDILSFGAGEPDFDTPDNIKEAGIKAIKSGFTKYTEVGGIPELKKAIIEKFQRDQGLAYGPDQILVSCGAKHSLYNLAVSLFEAGDEVIIPAPYWVTFPEQVSYAGATPVIIPTKESNRFALEAADLRKAVTKKTKAVILNSPNNPTGEILPRETLAEVAEFAVENKIYVISDECYEKLLYEGAEHVSIATLGNAIKEQTIIVNAVSKTYSMTGWRIGYAAGPREIIKAMDTVQSQATSNPTSIAQKAAVEALAGPQEVVAERNKEFQKRRDHIVDGLNKIDGITCLKPSGAFYVFPNVSRLYGKKYKGKAIDGSISFSEFLLEAAKVAVVPGIGFGSDAHIRLSYPYSIDFISEGVKRIREAVSRLAK
ncbi:MAG: pyridoxal phosphate-dependent aminotransferase [Nitrospinae bacterium]|nr:pyridoxal phosphate-dependent aminotransferase [Nitrospinota bacterium]